MKQSNCFPRLRVLFVAIPKKKKCLQTLANFIMTVKVAVNAFARSQVTAAYFVLMATPNVHQSRRGIAAAVECTAFRARHDDAKASGC